MVSAKFCNVWYIDIVVAVVEVCSACAFASPARIRCGETPLLTAIHKDDCTIITLLKQCGAHLTNADTKTVAEMLSLAARSGVVNRLESLRIAGADLNATDEIKQTPLHKAVLCNNSEVVRYLLAHDDVQRDLPDILGFTPLECAVKLQYINIVDMFNK